VTKWNRRIKQNEARELSKIFCKDFGLQYCEIYYVDRIGNYSCTSIQQKKEKYICGLYIGLDPPHILTLNNLDDQLDVLIHELVHHLQENDYEIKDGETQHGYSFTLAKRRVIRWCKKNISESIVI